jgi:hypothetical protein
LGPEPARECVIRTSDAKAHVDRSLDVEQPLPGPQHIRGGPVPIEDNIFQVGQALCLDSPLGDELADAQGFVDA